MRLGRRGRVLLGLVVLSCALGAFSQDECPNFVTIEDVPDDHKITGGNHRNGLQPFSCSFFFFTTHCFTNTFLFTHHPSIRETALKPNVYVMRLVKPPTVPYKYTELYLGMHSDSFHPELEMKLVTQKAVDGNTSAWSSRGCPAVTYVGTGAFASQRTFKTCTKSNSITTASNFRYDKITLAEPLSLLLRPSPHSPHLFFFVVMHTLTHGCTHHSCVRCGDLHWRRGDG